MKIRTQILRPVFIAVTILIFAAFHPANAQQIITNIIVPNNLGGIAVNPGLNKIYLAGGNPPSAIQVIDGTAFSQTSVNSGCAVDVDVTNNNYWTTALYTGYVDVWNSGNSAVAATSLGQCPIVISVDAPHRKVWVGAQCGGGNDGIWAVNADTDVVINGPIGSGGTQGSLLVNPVTGRLYIAPNGISKRVNPSTYAVTANAFGDVIGINTASNYLYAITGSSTLQIVDGSPDPEVILTNVSLPQTFGSVIGVNPVLNRVYVGYNNTNIIAILDATTGQSITNISLTGGITSVGSIAVDASRNLVYAYGYAGGSTYLSVIQDANTAPPTNSPTLGLMLGGPIDPAAAGMNVTFTGDGGSAGRAGGHTWYFTNAYYLSPANTLYWGVSNNGVAMSFSNNVFSGSEIMTFDPVSSSLTNGYLVWNGQTRFNSLSSPLVYTRFVMTVSNRVGPVALVLTNAAWLGLPGNIGAVVRVTTNLGYQATLKFQASTTSSSGPFSPALDLFDSLHPTYFNSTAYSSITAGFYNDTPPHLDANNLLTVNRGETNVITNSQLLTTDVESSPTNLIYTIAPNGQGGPPFNGSLQLNGVTLTAGGTFSQADINAGNMTYVQNGNCETSDNFQFNVNDSDFGVTPTGTFTTYTFHIQINQPNRPPVANNQSINIGLGAAYAGTLTGSDPDCVSQLSYRIVTPPSKGIVVINNTNTGAFTYTATPGQAGNDSFSFQVNDTFADAATAGVVSINITNQPPTPQPGSGTTLENIPFSGHFTATDPDQPPQTLTYSIVTNGLLGTAVVTNATNGGFIYTPNANVTGVDTIAFKAYDGIAFSAPGTFTITITNHAPTALAGSGNATENVVFNGQFAATDPDQPPQTLTYSIATNGTLGTAVITSASTGTFRYTPNTNVFGTDTIAFKANDGFVFSATAIFTINIQPTLDSGHLIVADSNQKALYEIDLGNGSHYTVTVGNLLQAPQAVAIEPSGNILVGDQNNGLIRVNHKTGAQTQLASPTNFTGFLKPCGIAIESGGTILVTDGSPQVQRFDPATGASSIVSSNGFFVAPFGIAVGSNGGIYVSDASGVGGQQGRIIRVNPTNGMQTLITPLIPANTLVLPTAMVLTSGNIIYVAEASSFLGAPPDKVFAVDAVAGTTTVISSNNLLSVPLGLAVTTDEQLIVVNNQPAGTSLVMINPTNGVQTGFPFPLSNPFGVAIVRSHSTFAGVTPMSDGSVRLDFNGEAGHFMAIQYSDDLLIWKALTGVPTTAGSTSYIDTSAIGKTNRFYRAFVY